jgi:RNA polymerase sigma factor (sigma-70 family)
MTDPRDDARLLAAWHGRHDAEAFAILCHRHSGLVEAVCRRHHSPDAAEAVQAVFLVLARRAGAVDGANLCGWLAGIARRVVLNQRRTVAARRRREQEAAMEQDRQRAAAADPLWAEALPHLDAALDSLSTGRREAVMRFYLQGKPQAEVAAELGCSVDAVKTRVHEGLAALRAFFARRGVVLGAAALASCLASEATAGEPGMPATALSTVLNPASAPGPQALARKVLTAMIIKTSALITLGVLLVASCLMAVLLPAAEQTPPPPIPQVNGQRVRVQGGNSDTGTAHSADPAAKVSLCVLNDVLISVAKEGNAVKAITVTNPHAKQGENVFEVVLDDTGRRLADKDGVIVRVIVGRWVQVDGKRVLTIVDLPADQFPDVEFAMRQAAFHDVTLSHAKVSVTKNGDAVKAITIRHAYNVADQTGKERTVTDVYDVVLDDTGKKLADKDGAEVPTIVGRYNMVEGRRTLTITRLKVGTEAF